jgi:hypothetical protein
MRYPFTIFDLQSYYRKGDMMMPAETIPLDIRIFCMHPPAAMNSGKPAEFGLQDKTGALTAGRPLPDGTLAFHVAVSITDDDPPKFSGKHAHGTPGERFIYLSYRYVGVTNEWIKRIKIPLKTITAAQIQSLKSDATTTLAARVDGRLSATVPVVWSVVNR